MIFLKRFKNYAINTSYKTRIYREQTIVRDIKINNLDIMESQTERVNFYIYFKYKNFSYAIYLYRGMNIYDVEYFKKYPQKNIKIHYVINFSYKIR